MAKTWSEELKDSHYFIDRALLGKIVEKSTSETSKKLAVKGA